MPVHSTCLMNCLCEKQGFMLNAVALVSTSSGSENTSGSKNTVLTKGKGEDSEEQISNSRILATLAKSLWMKDNVDFRMRVIAALALLIGAKVNMGLCVLMCSRFCVFFMYDLIGFFLFRY